MKPDWQRLGRGETLLGAFVSTGSTISAEVLGSAGFDFLVLDLEHGMSSERDILQQLQAMEHTGAGAVVRVESHERQRVHRILDVGAHGIMFPRVNTAEEARACVAAMRYPPDGTRGVAVLVRASGFGRDFPAYRDASKTALLTMLQIETEEAVQNVDEIAAVDGADVLFVGPMDLSTSLGVFRQYDHPKFTAAIARTLEAAKRHGRTPGILISSPADFRRYWDLGFRVITCGTDVSFLQSAAQRTHREMRDQVR
ncbi:MAG: aldolase/citrate lyase family protein [Bryobacteraceae bacterium]